MRSLQLLAMVLIAFALPAAAQTATPPPAEAHSAAAPMQFDTYQFIILRRPENATEYPQAKLDEIQRDHLAHLRQMAAAGQLMVAGPLDDQPDPRLRGLEIFKVGSVDEARRLAEDDPAVKAGRLEVVAMTWYTEAGALAFPIAEKLQKHHEE